MKRAVIVGCGNIAAVHAAVLTAQKDTELVGVADIHFEKAQDYAERFHTKPYASLEEMIEKEQPDVLHVCTPHYLHVPMTQYALERGINVFMKRDMQQQNRRECVPERKLQSSVPVLQDLPQQTS